MRLVGYVRVSARRGRSGESYQTKRHQREQQQAYAKLKGHRIVRWYEDEDWSGGVYERPGFQSALDDVESGKVDGLIVAKLDRFARSVIDANKAAQRIADAEGQLVIVQENIDTTTPLGRFVFQVFAAIAQLELERIKEGWMLHKGDALKRGVHICAVAPVGYAKDDATHRLVVDPVAAPIVRAAFAMRARGETYSAIGAMLRDSGVNGRGSWSASAVRSVLSNRAYLGEARHGRDVNADAHEALVDVSTWNAAQPTRRGKRRGSKRDVLLAGGLVRCAGCGYALSPSTMTDAGTGERLLQYVCARRHASGECPAPASVLARVVEPYVVARFIDEYGDAAVRETPSDHELADARLRVTLASSDLDVFIDAGQAAGLDRERLQQGIERRNALLLEAQEQLAAIETSSTSPLVEHDVSVEQWDTFTRDEQRDLLTAGIDVVFVFAGRAPIAERVDVVWHGDPASPENLPRRGARSTITSWQRRDDRSAAAPLA